MFGHALVQVIRGFCMGAADVVPGVSGGTIALVLGIYERLVATIRAGAGVLARLVRLDPRGALDRLRGIDLAFLLPLLAGIGLAIVTLAHAIEVLLEEQPVRMAGLFFGLVAGSILVALRLIKRPDARAGALFAAVAVLTFVVLGFRTGPLQDPSLALVLVAGAVAICAMILPGVSGSFILLMIGMYDHVLGAVTARDAAVLGVFLVGAVVGLASFSSLLNWLLLRHRDLVMAALVGLMAGSLRVLWPWPDGTTGTALTAPADDVVMPIALAIGAAAAVVLISTVESARAQRADVRRAARD